MKPQTAGHDPASCEHPQEVAAIPGEAPADGMLGLLQVLRQTSTVNSPAGRVPASATLHALPGMGVPIGHDVLRRTHATDEQALDALTPEQRVAVCRLITRLQRPQRLPD